MTSNHTFKAVIFDLDGVITKTALVHSRAWKEMFDHYLHEREQKHGESFVEFTHEGDYLTYVDGKPRYEGVKSFLESRKIQIPFGNPEDGVEIESCCGIGNRKNIVFNDILERDGIETYESTIELIHRLKAEGIKVGVASSSKNCKSVLTKVGLIDIIETRVDGEVSAELGLKGKPEADIFTTAADNLGIPYDQCVIVEDAISGVQAARKGNFGFVLGLAREENEAALYANGADIVVTDIEEIGFEGIQEWFEEGLEKDNWSLTYHDYVPEKERSREALLSVGNGYFGTRGAMEEMPINKINYHGTYMSGVYNSLISKVSGKDIENEDFVNVTNWLPISFRIENENWFDINTAKILEIRRDLDFKTGVLYKKLSVKDHKGRITNIESRRFAAMHQDNFAAIEYSLTPLNYTGKLEFKSELVGNHINEGVARYAELNQHHLKAFKEFSENNLQHVSVKTTQSDICISQTSKLDVYLDSIYDSKNISSDEEIALLENYKGKEKIEPNFVAHNENAVSCLTFKIELEELQEIVLQKIVFITDSLNKNQTVEEAKSELNSIENFDSLLKKSAVKWEELWKEADVELQGDRLTQKMLRLHLYHLMSTTSPNNESIDFSIPARGLTGEAYRGHIFWDELYILPVYFIHFPEVAKSVLMYRFRRLEEARKYAKEFGYQGAMFPWQSGSTGKEETQKYHFNPVSGHWGDDHSSLQRHVSLAIAYNILQYFHFTKDGDFMEKFGAEMLLEICRFWASKSELDEKTGRYSITKVMGPDEFHEGYPESEEGGLTDNAYTNIMSVWMFDESFKYLNSLTESERKLILLKIGLKEEELVFWNKISEKLKLIISPESIIAQYDGYFDLKELDFNFYKEKYGNVYRMDRLLKAEGKSPDDYKVAKQADMLMVFYNLNKERVNEILRKLNYQVSEDYVKKNLEYYLQRTSHGSTLSRVVHCYLANLIDDEQLSWELFSDAITSDYNDIQGGTTAEGIHSGVMAGTIWITLTAYAGLDLSGETPKINPKLPKHWRSLKFNFRFKGKHYFCEIEGGKTKLVIG